MQPRIFLFDMDNTLIDNDCDVSWKDFLMDEGLAAASEREEKDLFFRQYNEGRLDVDAFLKFQFRQFRGKRPEEMAALAQRHFEKIVRPRVYPEALKAVELARNLGAPTAILSSTCKVIAAPVAEHLGIEKVLATRLELRDGVYTGEIIPPYCLGTNKLFYARQFGAEFGATLAQAAYYGDSVNDIPVLEAVGFPTVINPSADLESLAVTRAWSIERWRL
jgi:HAD superfamily hydrolase (TIGR01490 family)